ncbi:MAG TPA: cobalamin B12-binding domain-containing protein [Desulfatiglandales bacterium]|nr:cobalamin B12-binding domain-containing protein [Desulfatiglandales bacterium]
MNNKRKIRVLVTKAGLDGHDRGAKVIAMVLKDAGMEVIYTGLHQTPEEIVHTAIQEDVNVIGLSILSGAHLGISKKILEHLKKKGAQDILLVVGGTIMDRDIIKLKDMGVVEVFPMGTDIDNIVSFFLETG